jgi:KipI family sensor histidine kinase inhibitor
MKPGVGGAAGVVKLWRLLLGTAMPAPTPLGPPLIQPLGDRGLIVRFAQTLSDEANRAVIGFARRLRENLPDGVGEIDPNLVSILLTYSPAETGFDRLAGELRLMLGVEMDDPPPAARHTIPVTFDGPDMDEVAASLKLSRATFVAQHCEAPLRVLTTGFAPGFVYCGFHEEGFDVPRRTAVRATVPAGTVLFAARQTAITSTAIPTGWHVIGHTEFRNFDAASTPPTLLREGDEIVFEALA